MLYVRPAQLTDLDALARLAEQAGPGFTSLQVGRDGLYAKLEKSVASFGKNTDAPGDEAYMLMLIDSANNDAVVGVSAVKAAVGQDGPYFNYKILRLTQSSKDVGRRFDMETLVLVNEYSGASEVGTLFVDSAMRGTGAGRLISQARYMLMATAPQRFSDTVISELRGQVTDDGQSVFWDAVGRPFFRMNFGEADRISAETDNEFIVDLMPKYPIYVDLLPQEARAAIGQTHPAGAGAKTLLEAEGFHYDRMVDIFDGGPSMRAFKDQLRTVRDSRIGAVRAQKSDEELPLNALISNHNFSDYRCIYTPIGFDGQTAFIAQTAMKTLGLSDNDTARYWIKR